MSRHEPRRFRATVPYYARYRLPYPDSLTGWVGREAALTPGDRVLDLGCGPGPLAIAFARMGMAVTGVDPEPDMLAAAALAARAAGVALDLRPGSSFDMPAGIGPFRLVTMGRSFHWMDREATLAALDRLVTAGGALALFGEDYPRTAENRWRSVLHEVSVEFGADAERHRAERRAPDYRSHESVLLRSAFSRLERVGVVVERTIGADDIVGLAFSLSVSSPEKLGERAPEFERALRAALAALSPDDRFTQLVEMSALIARRA